MSCQVMSSGHPGERSCHGNKIQHGQSCDGVECGHFGQIRPKVGQTAPKWDKSGIFHIKYQYILDFRIYKGLI